MSLGRVRVLTLVLIGLVFATGNAGKLSLLATGNPLIAPLTSLENSLVLDSSGSDGVLDESEINVRLLSSVGLAVGTKHLVSLGGDTLSLVSPPMLSFLKIHFVLFCVVELIKEKWKSWPVLPLIFDSEIVLTGDKVCTWNYNIWAGLETFPAAMVKWFCSLQLTQKIPH